MELREGEVSLKTFHHHPTPFVFILLKIIAGSFPFFLLLYLFGPSMSTKVYLVSHLIIIVIFILLLIYKALVYWLDRLEVTNQRIVYIDWRYLTKRVEYVAELGDIQDITTKEKGVISYFWIFDYGTFSVKTASFESTIEFVDAPDPEGIRAYIYKNKPN